MAVFEDISSNKLINPSYSWGKYCHLDCYLLTRGRQIYYELDLKIRYKVNTAKLCAALRLEIYFIVGNIAKYFPKMNAYCFI